MTDAIIKTEMSNEQINLIKRTVALGATDLELQLFLNQCKRTGLDPLSRQIHFIKRNGVGTIQTGIDGYRVIAERTGSYAGNDEPVFSYFEAGDSTPQRASVTVYRIIAGQRCPFTASAHWNEYYPGDGSQGFFWRKMPHGQLAKCAEALALRKAFPNDLSGIYTNEEMAQAGKTDDDEQTETVDGLPVIQQSAVPAPKEAKIEALKPQDASKPTSRPTSGATGKHAEIVVSPSGDMATIIGWLDNAAPRKDKKQRDYLMLTIDDVSVSCFDNKLWASVQAYKGQDVKAFVDIAKVGTKTYYNLISVVPLNSVSGIPLGEKADTSGPWDGDDEKVPF